MLHISGIRFALLLLICALGAACSTEEQSTVTIGTGGSGGNYQNVGLAIARSVYQAQPAADLRVLDVTTAGSKANLQAVIAGTMDFGIVQADHLHQALEDEQQADNLRSVFSLYTEAVTILAGPDTGIRNTSDLRDKVVDIGEEGSGTRSNSIDVLTAAGIQLDAGIDSRATSPDERLAEFIHGKLDAFFYTVGHPNTDTRFATYSVRGARFVEIDNIDQILASAPFYTRTLIDTNLYPRAKNEQNVETIGVSALLITSTQMPDDTVYELTRAVVQSLSSPDAAGYFPATMRVDTLLEGVQAPLHPGAVRAYRELGLPVPSGF